MSQSRLKVHFLFVVFVFLPFGIHSKSAIAGSIGFPISSILSFQNFFLDKARFKCGTDCKKKCGYDLVCQAKCFDTVPKCMPKSYSSLSNLNPKQREYESRLIGEFVNHDDDFRYVVSRDESGNVLHRGDSLLWSSIAFGSMDCSLSSPILESVLSSITNRGGAPVRYEPFPRKYESNATSRDQVSGLIFGIALRLKKCPNDREKLGEAWKLVRQFFKKHKALYPGKNPNYRITPGFSFMIKQLSAEFDLRTRPSGSSKTAFEAALVSTALSVRSSGGSCYPIHLATLNILSADLLKRPIKKRVFTEFCNATRGTRLPLTDWYCRRWREKLVSKYLADFDNSDVSKPEHRYEYRHQRCPTREDSDLKEGWQSPGVDFLILKSLAGR